MISKDIQDNLFYILRLLLVTYIIVVVVIFFFQRQLLFVPDTDDAFTPPPVSGEIIDYTSSDGTHLKGWYNGQGQDDRLTLVVFHGNAGNISNRLPDAELFVPAGYGYAIAGYRGFGGNPGSPTEDGLYNDARAFVATLHKQYNIEYKNMVLYGESLGTGIASKLGHEFDVSAVILEAPYTSVMNRAQEIYWYIPVHLLMRDRFSNIKHVPSLNKPVLILHGEEDQTIPVHHAHKLYKAAKEPKSLILLPNAGHNNVYEHGAHKPVLDFLYQLYLERLKREREQT